MNTSPLLQAGNKTSYSRRTTAEILQTEKKERLKALRKELQEIERDNFPGRIKTNDTLKKEMELLRLQKELNR